MLVPREKLIASVGDVYNAILIRGDAVEDVLFYGRGAGKFPTASAVVADIIDCAKHTQRRRFFEWEAGDPAFVASADEEETRLYVRARAEDPAQARAVIESAFPGASFLEIDGAKPGELAFITPPMRDGAAREALDALPGMKAEMVMQVAEF